MKNSLKAGIISGLIAGTIAGIVATFNAILFFMLGLYYWGLPHTTPITIIFTAEIIINLIWGVILGAIFSKLYNTIPGRGISKGLVYGLILYLIFSVRTGIMEAVQGNPPKIYTDPIFFYPIIYGLLLGIFYKIFQNRYSVPLEKKEIKKHNVKSGIHIGAIAGLLGGIAASITVVIGSNLGLWYHYPVLPITLIAALMVQDMIWGAVFGMLFVMFYEMLPGKGLTRSIFFALIIFFMTSFRWVPYALIYGLYTGNEIYYAWAGLWCWPGFFHFIVIGIVLGLGYRKPTK